MQDDMKHRLTRRSVWVRALYMVFFLIAYSIAEVVLGFVVLLQFVIVLVSGNANDNLLKLGNNLSRYVYQVFRFVTFNSEDQAFPFSDWPDEAVAEDNVWTQAPEEDAEPVPPAPELEPAAEQAETAPESPAAIEPEGSTDDAELGEAGAGSDPQADADAASDSEPKP